jgi:GTP-binding protein HflX
VLDGLAEGPNAPLDGGWRGRTVEVLNKADLFGCAEAAAEQAHGAIAISALTGEGLEALRTALDARLASGMVARDYLLAAEDGARLAWLYRHGEVTARAELEGGTQLTVRLSPADHARFAQLPP